MTAPRPTLEYAINNFFHLIPEYLQSCDQYYILHWDANYVVRQLLRMNSIVRKGINYTPVMMDGLSREILQRTPDTPVRLSFRRIKGKRGGVVLIAKTPVVTSKESKS